MLYEVDTEWTWILIHFPLERKMKEVDMKNSNYPIISDALIEKLKADFPNKLPTKEVNSFELGRLIGQQDIIDKLTMEKFYNEQASLDEDEEE